MYNICIIDDEIKAAEVVEALLLMFFKQDVSSISIFTDAEQASERLATLKPDLVFLDIKMPRISGLELLEENKDLGLNVIFVTAYDEFAIDALRKKAIDYLVKPLDEEDFIEAFNRFKNAQESLNGNEPGAIHSLKKNGKSANFKIALQKSDKTYFQSIDTIVRCEAQSNYTTFHIKDGTKLLSSKTLKEYDELLSKYDFLRIHKSHLINMQFVESLIKGGEVQMKTGTILPIAKRRRAFVNQSIMKALDINTDLI